ncbi:MAG: IclR family transcriptional regulator [Thermogemmatispora sp.]|uniref:IclR family transcriptional regulator n=1 Tax=Thermogemmatispora TaxID=768669 RepID=UPI00124D07DB|nr:MULTISPECIES: IclR family transcriptional regulator [Thermogemmatispora]MBE3567747.1 IclR family transcriptional regulator [Thermogemmatispora sp.]GER85475.1 IclR family transcriptional regulator [Thermogemmatispora aurantia]
MAKRSHAHHQIQTSSPSESKRDILRSAQRVLAILELIARTPGGLTVRAVSKLLQLNISTCYHSLNTLLTAGYVERLPSGHYVLGPQIPYLNDAYLRTLTYDWPATDPQESWRAVARVPAHQPSLSQRLRPILHSLSERSQEPAYLAGWRYGEVELQAIVEPAHAERIPGIYIGYRGHAHAHALGKVLLAYSPPAFVEDYLARHTLIRLTQRTIVERTLLCEELHTIAHQGYSIDREELHADTACLAAPVRDAQGRVMAAIAISFRSDLLSRRGEWLTAQVLRAARQASAELRLSRPCEQC